jgi:opacity protein-like surface antigen
MKQLVLAALVALAVLPVASQAQSDQPVTRAEVHSDLKQLEQAGYSPAARDPYYPADIQAAESRVHGGSAGANGYGPSAEGTSVSGPATTPANAQ